MHGLMLVLCKFIIDGVVPDAWKVIRLYSMFNI